MLFANSERESERQCETDAPVGGNLEKFNLVMFLIQKKAPSSRGRKVRGRMEQATAYISRWMD